MTAMENSKDWSIGEEELYAAQPNVRALVVQRYEALYSLVQQYIEDVQEGGRPPDPRYLEIGVRILRELSAQYRLGQAPRMREEDDDPNVGMDRGQLVLSQLAEIEAKVRAAQEAGGGEK
jgi:hypothetical protein